MGVKRVRASAVVEKYSLLGRVGKKPLLEDKEDEN